MPRPEFRITRAVNLIKRYGGTDGEHHKTWVIDQIARELLGDQYEEWVRLYEDNGTNEWDTGTAP